MTLKVAKLLNCDGLAILQSKHRLGKFWPSKREIYVVSEGVHAKRGIPNLAHTSGPNERTKVLHRLSIILSMQRSQSRPDLTSGPASISNTLISESMTRRSAEFRTECTSD
jgi:hypothetical protein